MVHAFVYMILLDSNVCLNVHTPGRAFGMLGVGGSVAVVVGGDRN